MRKSKFNITAMIAIIVCFALAVSLLAGCSSTFGKDGVSPHIGENGNWWIGDVDTGVKAAAQMGADGKDGVDGKDGADGITPHIGENGNWWIGDVDTGIKADAQMVVDGKDGADGITPHIGANGNWWIGDVDTGVKVTGQSGTDGKNGTDSNVSAHLGANGNWWVGDVDTGVKATGQNVEEAEYVTPEMFGAVGNGKANDTAAVQSALKTGKPVFLRNTYKVKELDCTGIEKIVMYGKEDVTARLSTFPLNGDTYNIIFEGKELFKNAPGNISLQEIRFLAKNYGTLITTKLDGAWVHKCNFTNFGGLFMGGMHKQCQISENVLFKMQGSVATDCADSIISNNYINSALSKYVILFKGTDFTGMSFQGNFVDYCKIAFQYDHWEFNRIVDNGFASIFRVFDLQTMFNDTTITGNRFSRINRTSKDSTIGAGLPEFGKYADDEMKNTPWTVFYIRGECNRVNISGNSGTTEASLIFKDVNRPVDVYIDVLGMEGEIEFNYYNASSTEKADIYVKDLDYITVDSLPSPLLLNTSGATLTSFNNQHVFYQGNLYVNNNGAWLQLTNNG